MPNGLTNAFCINFERRRSSFSLHLYSHSARQLQHHRALYLIPCNQVTHRRPHRPLWWYRSPTLHRDCLQPGNFCQLGISVLLLSYWAPLKTLQTISDVWPPLISACWLTLTRQRARGKRQRRERERERLTMQDARKIFRCNMRKMQRCKMRGLLLRAAL